MSYKRGFDRQEPDTMGVPSYVAGTRTFSLAVKGGESYFGFWSYGKRYNKTTTQSVIWPIDAGTYYFYFDEDGELQYVIDTGFTSAIFIKSAICGLVHWNGSEIIVQAKDEQHGGMEPATHLRLHLADGAKYAQGGDITGLVDASSTYTSIAAMLSVDEDINIMTAETTTAPFLYREGATGVWKQTAVDNNIGHIASGDTYISWNEWTGSTWQLTESASSTDYIIYYFLWTNDSVNPIKKLVGQQPYASRSDARDGLLSEIGKIDIGGFPSTEAYLMYAYIAKRNGTLEDDGEGNTYVDLRGKIPFNAS